MTAAQMNPLAGLLRMLRAMPPGAGVHLSPSDVATALEALTERDQLAAVVERVRVELSAWREWAAKLPASAGDCADTARDMADEVEAALPPKT